jgi:hypothetical protein
MTPYEIVQLFSKATGIKDPYIDTMLSQQAQQHVLWMPMPDSSDPWNTLFWDQSATTTTSPGPYEPPKEKPVSLRLKLSSADAKWHHVPEFALSSAREPDPPLYETKVTSTFKPPTKKYLYREL